MTFTRSKAALTALAVLTAAPAHAITANDVWGLAGAEALGLDSVFDSVVAIYDSVSQSLCTGSLISSNTIATARHCTDGMTAANTSVYFGNDIGGSGAEAIYSAGSFTTATPDPGAPGDYFNGTDFALITLTTDVIGYNPYSIFAHGVGDPIYTETALLAGFGSYGTGSTGPANAADAQIRAAFNTMDQIAFNAIPGGTGMMLYADFDDPNDPSKNVTGLSDALTYEGLVGGGDSGGPLMFLKGGEWVVAGVLTGTYETSGDSVFGNYGDVGAWTSFYSAEARSLLTAAGGTFYTETIGSSEVPLPASGLLLLGALGGFGLYRRRKT